MALGGSGTPGAVRPGDLGPGFSPESPGVPITEGRWNFPTAFTEPVTGIQWGNGELLMLGTEGQDWNRATGNSVVPSDDLNVAGNPPIGVNAAGLFDGDVYGLNLNFEIIDVTAGDYTLQLISSEDSILIAGGRVFDVRINGVTVDSGVDMYALHGSNSWVREYAVTVPDLGAGTGIIDVQIDASAGAATGIMKAVRFFPSSFVIQPDNLNYSNTVASPVVFPPPPPKQIELQLRGSSIAGSLPSVGALAPREPAVNIAPGLTPRLYVGLDSGAFGEVGAPGRLSEWVSGESFTEGDACLVRLPQGQRVVMRAAQSNFNVDPLLDHDGVNWRPELALDNLIIEFDSNAAAGPGQFDDLQKALTWLGALSFFGNTAGILVIATGTHILTAPIEVLLRMGSRVAILAEAAPSSYLTQSEIDMPTLPGTETAADWTLERDAYIGVDAADHATRASARFDTLIATKRTHYSSRLVWESGSGNGFDIKSELGNMTNLLIERQSTHAGFQLGNGISIDQVGRSSIKELQGCLIAGWENGIVAGQSAYLGLVTHPTGIIGCRSFSLFASDSWLVANQTLVVAHSGTFIGQSGVGYGAWCTNCSVNFTDALIVDTVGPLIHCRSGDINLGGFLGYASSVEGAQMIGCNGMLQSSFTRNSDIGLCRFDGVKLEGSNMRASNVTSRGHGGSAFLIEGSSDKLIDCHALASVTHGFHVFGGSIYLGSTAVGADPTRSIARNNTGHGFANKGGACYVFGAILAGNGNWGSFCRSGDVLHQEVAISGNTSGGFRSEGGGDQHRLDCTGAQVGSTSPAAQTVGANGTIQAGSTVT